VCGIAGIFNSTESLRSLEQSGKRILEQISHRGPDGKGLVVKNISQNSNLLLAHTRLSIIDLSSHASQPMKWHDKKTWIVFNGEIYNFFEIRLELIKEGVTFKTQSDTEVILAAYRFWGLNCFERFIGMWALAIWDELQNKLILSRDRLGIKPLYFAKKNSTWYFGSEPKVILSQLPELKKLNKKGLSDYFSYRQVLGNATLYKGINKVEAGTHIIISKDNSKVIKYWDLDGDSEKQDLGEDEVNNQLSELIQSSVSYRMISDVPIGSFLSGGLDSSILVQQMSKLHKKPIKTYTTGFSEAGFNEFKYAREVADYFKTDHTEMNLDPSQYLNSLETMIQIKDAPLAVPNEVALHLLSKELKKDISVVLSGEGADELFGGYGRIFRSAYDFERVFLSGHKDIPKKLRKNLTLKYKNLIWDDDLDHFLTQYSYIEVAEKNNLFTPDLLKTLNGDILNREYFESFWPKLNKLSFTDKYLWTFQKVHLEGLLGRLDSATMSASVEGRVPFVDHRLIEFVNLLPIKHKIKWKSDSDKRKAKELNSDQISEKHDITKYSLRNNFYSKLPQRISQRKKVGFPVPLSNWLSGPMREYAIEKLLHSNAKSRDLFSHQTVKNILSQKEINTSTAINVWMMLNTELWLQNQNISF